MSHGPFYRSSKNTPYHCGFFLQIWDKLFKTTYPEEKGHFAAEDARRAKKMYRIISYIVTPFFRKNGERTMEEFSKVTIPDYSVLLRPMFWMTSDLFKINAKD